MTDTPTEHALKVARTYLVNAADGGYLRVEYLSTSVEELARLIDRERAEAAARESEAWRIVERVATEGLCRAVTGETKLPGHALCWAFDNSHQRCFVCDARAAIRARGEGEW